jgi:hypothetical protein
VNQRLGSTRQLKTALASPRMAEVIHQALERSFVTANPLTAKQASDLLSSPSCDGISDSQCSAGGAPLILITCAVIKRRIYNLLVKHNRPCSPQNFWA